MVSEQLTSFYGSRKGILAPVTELSPWRLEPPFCQNYLEKYQGVPAVQDVQVCKTKPDSSPEREKKHHPPHTSCS